MRNTAAILVLLCAWPGAVFAQQRVVVGDIRGSQAKPVRAAIENVLQKHGIEVVGEKQAQAMARRSGAELDSESGRVRVAKRMHVQAFIEGNVRTEKRKLKVTLTIFGAADGMQSGVFSATATKPSIGQKVQAGLWPVLDAALRGGPPPAAEPIAASRAQAPIAAATPAQSPKQATTPRDAELPPSTARKQEPEDDEDALAMAETADRDDKDLGPSNRPSPLYASFAARFGTRDFDYNDSLGGLRGYSLGISPSVALQLQWFPAAHFSDGVLANIGIDLRGDMLMGVSSKNSAGQKFDTSSRAFGLGLRGRLPLGKLELGALAGFGQHSFAVANYKKVDPEIPDVVYSFVRTGLEGRLQIVPSFAVQLRAAYLIGLSMGEIEDNPWFPHSTGNGVEGDITLSYRIADPLWVEAGFGLQRYFLSLNPLPKDSAVKNTGRVAGGAIDQYLSSKVGIGLRL